jgi:hypothetical protein
MGLQANCLIASSRIQILNYLDKKIPKNSKILMFGKLGDTPKKTFTIQYYVNTLTIVFLIKIT